MLGAVAVLVRAFQFLEEEATRFATGEADVERSIVVHLVAGAGKGTLGQQVCYFLLLEVQQVLAQLGHLQQ
jgi:hypothetical protein